MISTLKKWLLRIPALKAFYASQVKKRRTELVVRTLSLAHAAELAGVPGEEWPRIRERQAKEILAVRDGKLDIVDRRSYQWPFLPLSVGRSNVPTIKFSPSNIRVFAKTPAPRRAINLVKGSILSLAWDVVPIEGDKSKVDPDTQLRIEAAKYAFAHPNNTQSWQEFVETGIDDLCTLGAMVVEPQVTPYVKRPFKLWNVDSATIRIYPNWTESKPELPRYAQMMGLQDMHNAQVFRDRELIYIKDNPTVDSPFGLGKMEVAFQHVADLIGVQRMAGRAGSTQTHPTWLWWESGNAQQNINIIRRHLDNDLEGQSRINMIGGVQKPESVEVKTMTDADLFPEHQEMLLRMIGNAFDLSSMSMGVEQDVNRAVGQVLSDKDFRSCIVPVAMRLQAALTMLLHNLLGWTDLKFAFVNLEDPDMTTKLMQEMQLWNMNARTSNEVRIASGKPLSTSPFADLTMFELSLVTLEAQNKLQDKLQANNMQRQQSMQESMMDQYGQPPGGDGDEDQGSGGMGASSKPSTKLGLAKSAMYGCMLNAKQVAALSLAQFKKAIEIGAVTADPNQLTDQMTQQEGPGILLELAPEVTAYIQQLKQKQAQKIKGKQVKPSSKAIADQEQKFAVSQRQRRKDEAQRRKAHKGKVY